MAGKIIRLLKQASTNKIMAYTFTRYIIYGIQFVVSLLCAAKMGPYYYGVWGFIIMLLNYMQRIDLGIPNAVNIILVQEKDNKEEFARTQSTAFVLLSVLCVAIMLFALGNSVFNYGFMNKYPVGGLFYVICVVAMISYYVTACTGIYRVRHKLLEIAIAQSIIPLLLLVVLLFAKGKELLIWFTLSYLIGNVISLLIYILGGKLTLSVRPNKIMADRIVKKGFYLFLYNACFYFIMISTRTVISSFYPVEQFGYFTFAFSLADAVILLLGAITFLMFPKLISKLNSNNTPQVKSTIKQLRNNYIPVVHIMMYIAFLLFPIIVLIFPKYNPALPAMYMVGLALIMETTSCGYADYLMAQNKERQIAGISVVSLIINILVALLLVKVVRCSFVYVMGATLFSYWVYSLLCIVFGLKQMGERISVVYVLKESFPFRLLIPYLSSALFLFCQSLWLLPVPLFLFIILNIPTIKVLLHTFQRLIGEPEMLDVEGV